MHLCKWRPDPYFHLFDDDKTLSLIVNLEFYYVYGFYYDGTVHAYKGEAFSALTNHGFECTEIPFGDSYPDIEANLSAQVIAKLKRTIATKDKLMASLATVANEGVLFTDKCEEILVVFWSLIEGIRFQKISSQLMTPSMDLAMRKPMMTSTS